MQVVLLTVTDLVTESPTDFLAIFDGYNTSSRMIALLSGSITDLLSYNSTQRYLLVAFFTNSVAVYRGFSATYSTGITTFSILHMFSKHF